jgi:hypothetical protein
MLKQIILGASVTWCGATLLGLLYAACTSGRISFDTLRLPGVIPVALLISTGIAVLVTPLFVWSFRSGGSGLFFYGAALFVLLLIYIAIVAPINPFLGLYGSVLLGVASLVIIGFLPR